MSGGRVWGKKLRWTVKIKGHINLYPTLRAQVKELKKEIITKCYIVNLNS